MKYGTEYLKYSQRSTVVGVRKRAVVSDFFFVLFFFTRIDVPFSLSSFHLFVQIISRRTPLSFVAAAAEAEVELALEPQKKIHLVASSQE